MKSQPNVSPCLEELLLPLQWVAWWSVVGHGRRLQLPNGTLTKPLKRQNKPHKLPIDAKTGGLAAINRNTTRASFDVARSAVAKWSLTGVGSVFTNSDPYSGVDLDNCRDPQSGNIADWEWDIIRILDSYSEISPSGTGIHIIVRADLPVGWGNQATRNGGKIGMFSRLRYFTFTGEQVPGTSKEIRARSAQLLDLHSQLFGYRLESSTVSPPRELPTPSGSDNEVIQHARIAQNGTKFDRVWRGLWESDYASQSEADLALCCMLAFWTDRDAPRMDRLFRQSGLMRPKWTRRDYRELTIARAIGETVHTYRNGYQLSSAVRRDAKTLGKANAQGAEGQTPHLLSFPQTDIGNAERLVRMYGCDIRFCSEMKKWLAWDGRRWRVEDARRLRQLFKKTMREMYKQAADCTDQNVRAKAESHARKSESVVLIRAALECTESEEGIWVAAAMLDTHFYLLNCTNGTLDQRTGRVSPANRGHLVTKVVHCAYRHGRDMPSIHAIPPSHHGDNPDAEPNERARRLVAYLQKCFGRASRISSRTIRISEMDLQAYLDGRANVSAPAVAPAKPREAAQCRTTG